MQHGGADQGLFQQHVGAEGRDPGIVDQLFDPVGGGGVGGQNLKDCDRVRQRPGGLVQRLGADQDVRIANPVANPEAHFLGDPSRVIAEQTGQGQPQVDDDPLVRVGAADLRDYLPPVEFILTLLPIFPGEEGVCGP